MRAQIGAAIGIAGIVLLSSFAEAQTAGDAQPPPVSAQPDTNRTTTIQGASPSFGGEYGTSNIAKAPRATEPAVQPTGPSELKKKELKGVVVNDVLLAQNRRRQAPKEPKAYYGYVDRDELLKKLDQLARTGVDPALLVTLAWNHVALDMTSIDHTTEGRKLVKSGFERPLTIYEPTFGEQFGPPRSSRAMAMVHLAMFEAANTIDTRYQSYRPVGGGADFRTQTIGKLTFSPTADNASIAEAISAAAHSELLKLYPRKATLIEADQLRISTAIKGYEVVKGTDEGQVQDRMDNGRLVGEKAAEVVFDSRSNDGAVDLRNPDPTSKCKQIGGQPLETIIPEDLCREPYFVDKYGKDKTDPTARITIDVPNDRRDWTVDPIYSIPVKLGGNWSKVTPFALQPHEFIDDAGIKLPKGTIPVPSVGDMRFKDALAKGAYGRWMPNPHGRKGWVHSSYGVVLYGGDPNPPKAPADDDHPPVGTKTKRTSLQTLDAQLWGYDATALLCAPPRLYNMVATSFYLDHIGKLKTATGNPVEAARYLALVNLALADAGIMGWDGKFRYHWARPVTYLRDLGGSTANWTPLGQVASNGTRANTTPPFPAYPSGHAVFGAAAFDTMKYALGLTGKPSSFDFVSDEFNGLTYGPDGKPRPFHRFHFISLDAAKWENAESRVWLGVHWQTDADDGIALGEAVALAVTQRLLGPIKSQ